MDLASSEVVMTVGPLFLPNPVNQAQDVQHGGVHHELAVGESVVLRPFHHLDVLLEGRPSKTCQVAVLKLLGVLILGSLDEHAGDVVADPARP